MFRPRWVIFREKFSVVVTLGCTIQLSENVLLTVRRTQSTGRGTSECQWTCGLRESRPSCRQGNPSRTAFVRHFGQNETLRPPRLGAGQLAEILVPCNTGAPSRGRPRPENGPKSHRRKTGVWHKYKLLHMSRAYHCSESGFEQRFAPNACFLFSQYSD
jgi:hypothetical protein